MGQAFDKDGRLLGEAEGAAMREVFDKLEFAHRDAQEIRIRTIEESQRAEAKAGIQAGQALAERSAVQQPSVGRMVHYVAYGTPGGEFPAGVCRAATITDVTSAGLPASQLFPTGIPPRVSLCVMNPTGLFFNQNVPYDPSKAPGTWHWPERV